MEIVPVIDPTGFVSRSFLFDPIRGGNHPFPVITEGLAVGQRVIPNEPRRSPGEGIDAVCDLGAGVAAGKIGRELPFHAWGEVYNYTSSPAGCR